MGSHWGYPEQPAEGTVQMIVPADMVDTIGAMLADPDGFVASLQQTEQSLGLIMIEVESGVWIDPRRIAALTTTLGRVYLHLDTGKSMSLESRPADAVLRHISAKLSEATSNVGGSPEGET